VRMKPHKNEDETPRRNPTKMRTKPHIIFRPATFSLHIDYQNRDIVRINPSSVYAFWSQQIPARLPKIQLRLRVIRSTYRYVHFSFFILHHDDEPEEHLTCEVFDVHFQSINADTAKCQQAQGAGWACGCLVPENTCDIPRHVCCSILACSRKYSCDRHNPKLVSWCNGCLRGTGSAAG